MLEPFFVFEKQVAVDYWLDHHAFNVKDGDRYSAATPTIIKGRASAKANWEVLDTFGGDMYHKEL